MYIFCAFVGLNNKLGKLLFLFFCFNCHNLLFVLENPLSGSVSWIFSAFKQ